MSNLNRDYLIKINVKEGNIEVPKMTFWNTDKKTSNMFIKLVINMSDNELIKNYVTVQNATDYKVTLNVVKPKSNLYKTIEADLLNETEALFGIDLPDEFKDQVGNYAFEFEVSSKVENVDESITTSSNTYTVNPSILTGLNEEIESDPDLPILKQLIEQVQSLQGADLSEYQKIIDNTLDTTDKSIPGAINELKSAIENVTSGTNGKEIELQKSTTHIQWRYVGDTDWNNLVALNDLRGSDGRGISSIENTAGMDLDMEYTITYTDGTTDTFWITNGAKGDKGDTGATPNLQIGTVETLASGSSATASITGTTENPLLNLGIPRGTDGSGTGGSSERGKKLILSEVLTSVEENTAKIRVEFDSSLIDENKHYQILIFASLNGASTNLKINLNMPNFGSAYTNFCTFSNLNPAWGTAFLFEVFCNKSISKRWDVYYKSIGINGAYYSTENPFIELVVTDAETYFPIASNIVIELYEL